MKITHNKVGNNLNISDSKIDKSGKVKSSAINPADAGRTTDKASGDVQDIGASKVSVSSRAQDMKKAKEIAKNTPDIREDRVAELQKAIDQGKYKVSAKDIADKMVDEEMMWVE